MGPRRLDSEEHPVRAGTASLLHGNVLPRLRPPCGASGLIAPAPHRAWPAVPPIKLHYAGRAVGSAAPLASVAIKDPAQRRRLAPVRAAGWDPSAAFPVAERRVAQERELVTILDAEPQTRRGRLRDVVAGRGAAIELSGILLDESRRGCPCGRHPGPGGRAKARPVPCRAPTCPSTARPSCTAMANGPPHVPPTASTTSTRSPGRYPLRRRSHQEARA